jgi:hypothetical protein
MNLSQEDNGRSINDVSWAQQLQLCHGGNSAPFPEMDRGRWLPTLGWVGFYGLNRYLRDCGQGVRQPAMLWGNSLHRTAGSSFAALCKLNYPEGWHSPHSYQIYESLPSVLLRPFRESSHI